MKEATGELNMTVVIVIAVGILAAFFYTVIWPLIGDNFDKNANCNNAICKCDENCRNNTGIAKCYVKGKSTQFECPWKG